MNYEPKKQDISDRELPGAGDTIRELLEAARKGRKLYGDRTYDWEMRRTKPEDIEPPKDVPFFWQQPKSIEPLKSGEAPLFWKKTGIR